jgi:putative PIG3 family NAD(P)H quinone oxidoreductase
MKCLQAALRDGRISAELVDIPPPVAGPGEVLVRVHASGLNRADLSQIAGRYPPPPGESAILGLEVSGRVVDSDEPVCALLGGGGHAELVAVPTGQCMPAPRSLDLELTAAIPEAFLTAYVNLIVEAQLRDGERVLIHAGASGVGLAAIQVAKRVGAAVAATTRTQAKRTALLEAGADLALVTGEVYVATEVERNWGKDAVNVVLDPIGGGTVSGDLQLLAPGGRVVVIATLGGARTELDLSLLMRKRGRLIGSMLRSRSREEKAGLVERFQAELLPAFDTGGLRITVDTIEPAGRAAAALQRMHDNLNVGKILLRWRDLPIK